MAKNLLSLGVFGKILVNFPKLGQPARSGGFPAKKALKGLFGRLFPFLGSENGDLGHFQAKTAKNGLKNGHF